MINLSKYDEYIIRGMHYDKIRDDEPLVPHSELFINHFRIDEHDLEKSRRITLSQLDFLLDDNINFENASSKQLKLCGEIVSYPVGLNISRIQYKQLQNEHFKRVYNVLLNNFTAYNNAGIDVPRLKYFVEPNLCVGGYTINFDEKYPLDVLKAVEKLFVKKQGLIYNRNTLKYKRLSYQRMLQEIPFEYKINFWADTERRRRPTIQRLYPSIVPEEFNPEKLLYILYKAHCGLQMSQKERNLCKAFIGYNRLTACTYSIVAECVSLMERYNRCYRSQFKDKLKKNWSFLQQYNVYDELPDEHHMKCLGLCDKFFQENRFSKHTYEMLQEMYRKIVIEDFVVDSNKNAGICQNNFF